MNRRIWLGSVAVAASLALSPAAWAQQAKQDFTLVNKTGYALSEVYVSPTKSDDWEEDILGRDVMENGDSVHISFRRAAKSCLWDLKVVYQDDDSESYWEEIDLCSVSRITIMYDRKTDTSTATFD
ncbi:hypothetical protein GCM10017083_05910 [Thalassobaculum fulvum]|jgi:hypothetical protein|uniref:Argininosuccinate lyase n=1 Tax=Thalassobaculum fulvum TaxID=1633335 RepID=A0A918XNS4_9PROT|nr:argininosuccinate lyase [Thalassobaculum fulvum]GHD41447.1 hypothetical protein GCM10017083_05910 [Thalassobaculum fulvum]